MGEYILEECSLYEHKQIKGKDVYIFDSHNMALPVWGMYSHRMNMAFNLVTFDSHTDTRLPFTAEVTANSYDNIIRPTHPVIKKILKGKKYKKSEFSFEDVFKLAVSYVKNDEHIQTADFFGYIKSYNVICGLDDFEARSYERDDRVMGYDARYYIRKDLKEVDLSYVDVPIILDFDLDYFIWEGCFSDTFENIIAPLVKNATVITIAREPNFFDECKIIDDFTCEMALERLLTLIEKILNTAEESDTM